jgi:hypothetical protein
VPLAVLALLAACAFGIWLFASGDEPDKAAPTGSAPASSSPDSTSSNPGSGEPGEPGDVARLATAQVPATAPPNQDLSGNMVRYEARNMLDGVPETCWRMSGDGTGEEITVALAEPTTLTSVGLINGYAKVATDARGRRLDWYHGNRRLLAVEWVFDDGTTVSQPLEDTPEMQTLDIDPVTTSSVRLRLVSVSAPGSGRAARNYTAISDLALVGTAS